MTTDEAIQLLEDFRAGKISARRALRAFQAAPVADLGFAQVDTHRALRKGFPEVIYAAGKTARQVVEIASQLAARESRVLITRLSPEQARPRCERNSSTPSSTRRRGASRWKRNRCPSVPG
jgi:NCAIR mutase (PurE)-related protein